MSGRVICGVDEVGRGPLAGPVVAACVHIPDHTLPWLCEVTDSKKLSSAKRKYLSTLILNHCTHGIGIVHVEEIDRINILQATFKAMEMAIAQCSVEPHHLLIDGNRLPKNLPCTAEAIVKGDSKVKEIACASIIAKVYRDALMEQIANDHPEYHWHKNAGYGTAHHLYAIAQHGITTHHRRSFAPIRHMLKAA